MNDVISYSVKDAVRVTALSKSTLYLANARGQLEFKKIGSRTLIMRDELERFIRECGDGKTD